MPSFSPDPHAALEVVKLSQAQHYKPFYFLHIHMMQSIPRNTTVSAKNGFRIMGHTPCVSGSSRDLKNRVYESMVLCHGSAVEIDILPRSLPHPTLAPPHPSCMGKR